MLNIIVAVFSSVLTCIILIVVSNQQSKKKLEKSLKYIPLAMPPQHFLLGHAQELGGNLIEGLKKLCIDSARVDGLSRFYLVNQLIVSVTKAEHVKLVLKSSNFRQKIPLIDKHMNMLLGSRALVSLMNEDWRVMRKLVTKAFNLEYLKNAVQDINDVVEVFTRQLSTKVGEEVDLWPLMKCITLDVIGKSAFDYDFNSCQTLTSSAVADAFEYMLTEHTVRSFEKTLDPRSYFYDWPTSENKKYKECSKIIRSKIANIVNLRIDMRKSKKDVDDDVEHADLLKYLLDAHAEEGLAADTATLSDTLITMLFGGFDTSSIALTYAFYLMTQHRDVEKKAREEVIRVMTESNSISASGSCILSYDDINSKLPYCTAVMQEVLRLYPSAPLTVRSLEKPMDLPVDLTTAIDENLREDKIVNVTIPSGTMIYIPIWFIHRSPDNFSDPETFDPERFFDPERAKSINRYAHIAFSGGARDCVGRRFAMLEAVGVFAMLIRRFTFDLKPGYELYSQAMGVVQGPRDGMPVTVRLVQE